MPRRELESGQAPWALPALGIATILLLAISGTLLWQGTADELPSNPARLDVDTPHSRLTDSGSSPVDDESEAESRVGSPPVAETESSSRSLRPRNAPGDEPPEDLTDLLTLPIEELAATTALNPTGIELSADELSQLERIRKNGLDEIGSTLGAAMKKRTEVQFQKIDSGEYEVIPGASSDSVETPAPTKPGQKVELALHKGTWIAIRIDAGDSLELDGLQADAEWKKQELLGELRGFVAELGSRR